ncbi:SnoaL-like protein [Promicromonospora sp. AC04]|uniref:nuclear transport factor 2 family protein n=1 Tax=Promicromonospora sp. AC04 TaxID=2135723 RepID=UPI000D47FBA8|nr:nuclear transport factor 2 family protein [Promicromonospora sp. AC04]PUB27673.1 SnoaL-like protein [Promicromonospora sp. AC04]
MTTVPAPVDTYFQAWTNRDADLLETVLAPQVAVTGPLGHIDGAIQYQQALGHIFSITRRIDIIRQWVDGPDTLTWFDLHHANDTSSVPVANWVHVEGDLITEVRIAFDARVILR